MPCAYPRSSGHSKSDQSTRPLAGVMRPDQDSGKVEQPEPEEKHDSEEKRSPSRPHSRSDAQSGGDECRPCQIRPEQTSGHPSRDQAGNETQYKEMGNSEDDR